MDKNLFFKEVLIYLGITPNTNTIEFLKIWSKYEGGSAKNNPLNTTYDLKNPLRQSNYNTVKVKNYTTIQDGIEATAKTLSLGYYKNILAALRTGQTAAEIYKKPNVSNEIKKWGTVHFAARFEDQKKGSQKIAKTPPTITILLILGIGLFLVYHYYSNKQ